MAWFRQRNSSLLRNFSFKFHLHVLCGSRQKPNNCQLCRFQNGCLVILNNVQLQSTHCPLPPSPMGQGIPVDHWSTISSWQCSYHCSIMKFSGVITIDKSVHAKDQGQRSKVKVTEVKTQLSHFWTVTPVWIHIWRWNDAWCSIEAVPIVFQGHPSNFKVIRYKKFWPK